MNAETVEQFQKTLAERLSGLGIETLIAEGTGEPQVGGTLRALLTVNRTGRQCMTELMVSGMGGEYGLLTLYTTLALGAETEQPAFLSAVAEWNLLCPIGAYGVFHEDKALYHKYSYPFPGGLTAEALADTAALLLELVFEVVTRKWDDIAALCGMGSG